MMMHGGAEGDLGDAYVADQARDLEARCLAERAKKEALEAMGK